MFKKLLDIYRTNGLINLTKSILNHFYPRKAKSFKQFKKLLLKKSGFEIGGPSSLFGNSGLFPVYRIAKSVDNCNFSSQTVWEGQIKWGYTFKYLKNRSCGRQYILDAIELNEIESGKYDFVLSSHVIEHIANPIKALSEWIRVLKNEGILIVVIPHKDGTFDHKRNITTLDHIINDYNNDTPENDLTHLNEILELHDIKKDQGISSLEQFKIRSARNFENRCLHHHVFDTLSAAKLIDYMKLKILAVEAALPFNIIIIAKKSVNHDNKLIMENIKNKKFRSPFKYDK